MLKKLLVAAGVTTLAVGVVGATVAFAHGPGDGVKYRIGRGVIQVAADELGMERADLVAELKQGKSIADVAEEQDVLLEEITDSVLGVTDERLDEAVESGRITQERADNLFGAIEERLPDFLERDWHFHHWHRWHFTRLAARTMITLTAEELGMEKADVLEELRAGKSIADIAEEQGGSSEGIIDAFMVIADDVLAVFVEHNVLTEEEAAERSASTRERVTNHIDDSWPFPHMRGGLPGRGIESDRGIDMQLVAPAL